MSLNKQRPLHSAISVPLPSKRARSHSQFKKGKTGRAEERNKQEVTRITQREPFLTSLPHSPECIHKSIPSHPRIYLHLPSPLPQGADRNLILKGVQLAGTNQSLDLHANSSVCRKTRGAGRCGLAQGDPCGKIPTALGNTLSWTVSHLLCWPDMS